MQCNIGWVLVAIVWCRCLEETKLNSLQRWNRQIILNYKIFLEKKKLIWTPYKWLITLKMRLINYIAYVIILAVRLTKIG